MLGSIPASVNASMAPICAHPRAEPLPSARPIRRRVITQSRDAWAVDATSDPEPTKGSMSTTLNLWFTPSSDQASAGRQLLRDRPLPRRRLAFDRMNVDRAQAAQAQHVHFERAPDAVAIEHADQIVDAVDGDVVELDHDIAGQQTRAGRRSARLDLRQQGTHLVFDTGDHRVPSRDGRGLAGHADIGAPDIAVADDLREHELRRVA